MKLKHLLVTAVLLTANLLAAQTFAEKLYGTVPAAANRRIFIMDFSQFGAMPGTLRSALDLGDADDLLEDCRLSTAEVRGLSASKAEQGRRDAEFATILLKNSSAEDVLLNLERHFRAKGKKVRRSGPTLSIGHKKNFSAIAPDTISVAKADRGMNLTAAPRPEGNIPPELKQNGIAAFYRKMPENFCKSITIAIFRETEDFRVEAKYLFADSDRETVLNRLRRKIAQKARKIGDAEFIGRFAPLFAGSSRTEASITLRTAARDLDPVLDALEWDDDNDDDDDDD